MFSRTDELDHFKREINLAEFAASYGFQRNPEKSTRHTLSMEDDMGNHLVISTNPDNGHWRWFDPKDERRAGTVVDFLQLMDQVSIGEVRKQLRQWLQMPSNPVPDTVKPTPATKDRSTVVEYLQRFSPVDRSSYAESRGIRQDVLTAPLFHSRILKGFKGALIFPHYDSQGVCGYEVKTFGFTSFSSKGYKSLWVSRVPTSVRSIVVAESGIEALSYYQIKSPEDTLFVSPGGNWSKDVSDRLQVLMQRYPDAEVVGAFNQDKGGRYQCDRLRTLADAIGSRYRDDQPPREGADWNDMIEDDFGAPKSGNTESTNG